MAVCGAAAAHPAQACGINPSSAAASPARVIAARVRKGQDLSRAYQIGLRARIIMPMAMNPKTIISQVAGSGMGIVPGGVVVGGPVGVPGGPPPGGVPPGGVPPGGVPPGGVPSGGIPPGGGPGYRNGVLEKGGPDTGGPAYGPPGGKSGFVSNAGGRAGKTAPSAPRGRSEGAARSRTVERTRSRGPDLVGSSAPGRRSPGERSAKRERGSISAAMIFSLLTLLMASRPCPTAKMNRPTNRGASRSACLRLALRLAAMR